MEFNATFLISAISFIIFTLIMNKIFYSPLERVINEREKFINDTKLETQNTNIKADTIIKERDEKLNKSYSDAKELVAKKLDAANKNSKEKTENAKQKSTEEIASAKLNLQNEAKNSNEALKLKVKDLAEVISSKVLGMDVKIADTDQEIIDRILN